MCNKVSVKSCVFEPSVGAISAAYISLETVVIEDSGRVSFQPIPEDRELEVVYLAPELQQHGVVTEKVASAKRTTTAAFVRVHYTKSLFVGFAQAVCHQVLHIQPKDIPGSAESCFSLKPAQGVLFQIYEFLCHTDGNLSASRSAEDL